MPTRRPVAAAVLAATGLAVSACGGGTSVDELTVTGAWARPTPAGASNGVVYLTITSPEDDALLGVDVAPDIAADATVHESTGADGSGGHEGHGGGDAPMAGMTEHGRVELPAGEAVTFEPGGLHVMLTDLPEPLVAGERFDLTLTMEGAGTVRTQVVVAVNAP